VTELPNTGHSTINSQLYDHGILFYSVQQRICCKPAHSVDPAEMMYYPSLVWSAVYHQQRRHMREQVRLRPKEKNSSLNKSDTVMYIAAKQRNYRRNGDKMCSIPR